MVCVYGWPAHLPYRAFVTVIQQVLCSSRGAYLPTNTYGLCIIVACCIALIAV